MDADYLTKVAAKLDTKVDKKQLQKERKDRECTREKYKYF